MTASAETVERFTHQGARERWGEPDEWCGSVNDPRVQEEHGLRFNEKWVYLLRDGARRILYWDRYDFQGMRIESPDGAVHEEPL